MLLSYTYAIYGYLVLKYLNQARITTTYSIVYIFKGTCRVTQTKNMRGVTVLLTYRL